MPTTLIPLWRISLVGAGTYHTQPAPAKGLLLQLSDFLVMKVNLPDHGYITLLQMFFNVRDCLCLHQGIRFVRIAQI